MVPNFWYSNSYYFFNMTVTIIIIIIIIIVIIIFLLPTYSSFACMVTELTIFQHFKPKFYQRSFS